MTPLMDTHERRISYLRLSVTDRCNLRCRYCMPEEGVQWMAHDSIMSYEEYLRIIAICVRRGIDKIRLTGGEPLVRKGFTGFIARIHALKGVKDLSLTTNGVLLAEMVDDLKAAGITRVNISLDTLQKDKFIYITRIDAFERVAAGIKNARRAGLQVKINVVLMRGVNDDEILDFARLSLDEPVQIRFIELMPIGCAQRFGTKEMMLTKEIHARIESALGVLQPEEMRTGPASIFRIPGAAGTLGFIEPVSEQGFCKRCNRIRVSAHGQLRPCLCSDKHIDLLGPMREGITDEALEKLIECGVRHKPVSSLLHEYTGTDTQMFRIGG